MIISEIDVSITTEQVEVDLTVNPALYAIQDVSISNRLTALENLNPITIISDVVVGEQEAVSMPVGNPNEIGNVTQIETIDGSTEKVYDTNFTLVNSGRTAVFYSVFTESNSKIVLWPRES